MGWLLGIFALALIIGTIARRLERQTPPAPAPQPDGAAPPIQLVTDELDLHGIVPRQAGAAVDEFIRDARCRGRACVKVIHGKGIGVLRRRVRARLARHPDVLRWHDATSPGSGRGATVVYLRTADTPLAPAAPADLV